MKILIIEDNPVIADTLRYHLKKYYLVDVQQNGKKGLDAARKKEFDLILLDLGLPDISGKSICDSLRQNNYDLPIIILSGKSEVETKVEMLNLGADDYITKPFDFKELIARADAVIRRKKTKITSAVIEIEDLILDTSTRTVSRFGEPVKLRRKEFELLEYLMRNNGIVLTRLMILDNVWDARDGLYANVVDVHIKYLRDKIDRPYNSNIIKTAHGLGYKIESSKKL